MKMGVVFRSNRLPASVKIFSVNVKVEPYVTKVVMCNACLRYGHIAKYCDVSTVVKRMEMRRNWDDAKTKRNVSTAKESIRRRIQNARSEENRRT